PTPADYQEAIQFPRLCFSDPELQAARPAADRWGLPRPISGAFASVYQLIGGGEKHAVRCFLRPVPNVDKRYAVISDYLERAHLPFMVEFKYLARGIRVRGDWYPILKMEWIEGDRLDTYIAKNINNTPVLVSLAVKFLKLTHDLKRASVAHGDLQHGNILVVGGELRLIDYDGIYVPGLERFESIELGQPNYQHPARTEKDYGLYLDHFSEWVIYLTLVALAVDPSFRSRFVPGNEYLLMTRDDYVDPRGSPLLHALEADRDRTIQALALRLNSFLYLSDLKQVPSLDPPMVLKLPPVQPVVGVPGWLTDRVPAASGAATPAAVPVPASGPLPSPGDAWVLNYAGSPAPVSLPAAGVFERLLLVLPALAIAALGLTVAIGSTNSIEVAAAMGFVFGTAVLGLALRFNLLPETRERNKLLIQLRRLIAEMNRGEASLRDLQERLNRLETDRRETTRSLEEQRKESVDKEAVAAAEIRKRLQTRLAGLKAERQRLVQLEADERKRLTEQRKEQALGERLAAHPLNSSNPPGLPDSASRALARQGIRTVADVLDVQVVTPAGKSHPEVRIRTPFNRTVIVEGIDPSHARLILAWRRVLETRYRPQINVWLPVTQSAWIKAKYQARGRLIEYRESTARDNAASREEAEHLHRRQEREKIARRLEGVPSRFDPLQKELQAKMAEKKKRISDKQWDRARLERALEPYRGISFLEFLRKIVQS
ncbi:MAG: hypothetical protein ACM3JD_12240, partial [Rudaea sp.]